MKVVFPKVIPALSILALVGTAGCPIFAADTGKVVPPTKSYKPATPTKASATGKKLFEQNKCYLCHTAGKGGGCLAPPLNGVGARRNRQFIISRITDDKKEIEKFTTLYGGPELMPHKRLPRSQSIAIADYLMTLPEPKFGFKVVAHPEVLSEKKPIVVQKQPASKKTQSVVNKGRNLLSSKGCMACHAIGNIGGKFAPSFDHIGSRKTKERIKAQMMNAELLTLENDPEYAERGTVMPPMNLTDTEADDIADYLMTLE